MATPTAHAGWRWARALGWMIFAAASVAAVVRVATASSPTNPKKLTEAERAAVGRAAAAEEPKWREGARRSFPEDHWSQDDHASNAERSWVRGEAARRGVSQTEVFRAIDEDLRRHPVEPPRKATSAPAKPRAFYD